MTNSVDRIFFERLAAENPGDVCRRALCRYDAGEKCYTLSVWGDEYAIFPDPPKIHYFTNRFQRPYEYLHLFMIHYLLSAKEIEISSRWISEKDIPGGATFFRGPHEIPTRLIT